MAANKICVNLIADDSQVVTNHDRADSFEFRAPESQSIPSKTQALGKMPGPAAGSIVEGMQ